MQDKEYGDFHAKLLPTLNRKVIIGVRTPKLRALAKQLYNTDEADKFIKTLPHGYYEENNLHAFLIEKEKDPDRALSLIEEFLPYIDNWATCDSFSPIAIKQNKEKMYPIIKKWLCSEHTYTVRFGIDMLMKHYLDDNYNAEIPRLIISVKSDEYYIKMVVAWFFATALAKRYDDIIDYIRQGLPDRWTHNKAIQKATESFRITKAQKEYLKTLKR